MPYTDRYLETEPSRVEVDAREGVLLLECKKPSSCPPSPDVLTRFGNNKPPHRQMY